MSEGNACDQQIITIRQEKMLQKIMRKRSMPLNKTNMMITNPNSTISGHNT